MDTVFNYSHVSLHCIPLQTVKRHYHSRSLLLAAVIGDSPAVITITTTIISIVTPVIATFSYYHLSTNPNLQTYMGHRLSLEGNNLQINFHGLRIYRNLEQVPVNRYPEINPLRNQSSVSRVEDRYPEINPRRFNHLRNQ
ncbi:hypothetical protein LXL04_028647 [Taraxacum kok-saghyz]